jgi:hypothetical protein
MRSYVVQTGDSPASIAARFAGCPKCARDLIGANAHKPAVEMPNGFLTFTDLRAGETLNLPDKWFSPEFDVLPPTYFAALPYADGVTPSTLGDRAAGVLGSFVNLDAAAAGVDSLARMSDREFAAAVDAAASFIDLAVSEAVGSANPSAAGNAQDARAGAEFARRRAIEMAAAIEAGDQAVAAQARTEIQNVLSTALGSARLALQALHSGVQPVQSGFPANVMAAAQAAAAAIAADAGYCASVTRPGTSVNAAVHTFKTAWNASQSPKVPINTGDYEPATAAALARVVGNAPAGCAAHAAPAPTPAPPAAPVPIASQPKDQGLSTGAILGLGLLGAGAVGVAIHLATRQPTAHARRPPRIRRVRRVYPTFPDRGFS